MKSTTYRATLDNGDKAETAASSAAEAIESILWKNRGRTITEIHSGMTEAERRVILGNQSLVGSAGTISHDIPPHVAIPAGAVKPKRVMRKTDETEPMFAAGVGVGGKLSD